MIKERYARVIDASDLLTPVSRDSRDIQEEMRIWNVELNTLWDVMLDIFSNQFIQYMTDYGLSQWEEMLDISPAGGVEDRRIVILKELAGQRPYTLESFQKMLDAIYGKGSVIAELDNDKYALWFKCDRNAICKVHDIYDFAEVIVPKNLILLFKNVKEVQGGIHLGGYVEMRGLITIGADNGFSINPLKESLGVAGVVTFANKHINI